MLKPSPRIRTALVRIKMQNLNNYPPYELHSSFYTAGLFLSLHTFSHRCTAYFKSAALCAVLKAFYPMPLCSSEDNYVELNFVQN